MAEGDARFRRFGLSPARHDRLTPEAMETLEQQGVKLFRRTSRMTRAAIDEVPT